MDDWKNTTNLFPQPTLPDELRQPSLVRFYGEEHADPRPAALAALDIQPSAMEFRERPHDRKPNPAPFCFFPASPCSNARDSLASSSGLIPTPVSATESTDPPGTSSATTSTSPPVRREFQRVGDEVEGDLSHRLRIRERLGVVLTVRPSVIALRSASSAMNRTASSARSVRLTISG